MQSADCNTPMQGSGRVQVISRRMVRAEPPPPASEEEEIHLTPWDLRMLTVEYIQDGIVLPKPTDLEPGRNLVDDRLSPAFARALRCFYPLAGRLVVAAGERGTTASLLCTGEGAELVHAAAPGVTAADVAAWQPPPRDAPREPVYSLFPLNGLLCVDAAASTGAGGAGGGPRRAAPLLAAQVTELADAVFVAVSLNHAAGDGTTFWHFVNTWSYLARGGGGGGGRPPPPVLKRWFPDGFPVPVPLQFAKVQHAVRQRRPPPPLHECSFHFSGESVRNLKARANAELSRSGGATAPATVSSLQALLAHLWRSVCRARRLEPSRSTAHVQFVGCRGRVTGVPPAGYVGNAVVPCRAASTAGEVAGRDGLGRAAGMLARAVASLVDGDGAAAALVRESMGRWAEEQRFAPPAGAQAAAAVVAGNSPRLDVYGNDFGWGKPVAVRCGPGNAADGKCTVYEGRGGGGAICLEVCLAPDAMARLVADEEFMDAVSAPPCP
ncbi:unnamed protein product [Urochloa humidicola]